MMKALSIFFNIIYSVLLITSLTVNLADSGELTWFFVVLAGVLLSFTVTNMHAYVKRYKLLIVSLSSLASSILLLGVTTIYMGADWFGVATSSVVFAYIMIFIPIFLCLYLSPNHHISGHCALIVWLIDLIALLSLLFTINLCTGGDWYLTIAVPITLFCSPVPLFLIVILRYLVINIGFKASLSFIVLAIAFVRINVFLASILGNYSYNLDLINVTYSGDIAAYLNAVVILTLSFLGVIFGILGFMIRDRDYGYYDL
ncbi:hypothetical protein [Haloplasma contractile]|uniref:Uncharacterized protein n=1 Tax=Haloplasma contractile SSD-17B TaxID=1033810 RepID=U2E7T9_9MOLU|nr:hypothetical protein [Haloplasma contractile]ERJ11263.1 hypothetical protein HLPCO_002703 [Haloplasma contractile SSD-17B]